MLNKEGETHIAEGTHISQNIHNDHCYSAATSKPVTPTTPVSRHQTLDSTTAVTNQTGKVSSRTLDSGIRVQPQTDGKPNIPTATVQSYSAGGQAIGSAIKNKNIENQNIGNQKQYIEENKEGIRKRPRRFCGNVVPYGTESVTRKIVSRSLRK